MKEIYKRDNNLNGKLTNYKEIVFDLDPNNS